MGRGKRRDMMRKVPGMAWRVSLSIIVSIGWLVFLILWLFFYADDYTIYQNIAIFFVSILVMGAILAVAWASWGMKFGYKYRYEFLEDEKRKSRRPKRRK